MTPVASCVIVAAGSGVRFGHAGKVLADVADRPVLAWVLDAMECATTVRDVVIVYGAHTESAIRALVADGPWTKVTALVQGGSQRQESMANGVHATGPDVDIVLVHDAARPLIAPGLIDRCVVAAAEHGAAILATPISDTIKRAPSDVIDATIDRTSLWAAQTPQAFRRETLLRMIDHVSTHGLAVTDEASMAEACGVPVRIVPGDRLNMKLTHPDDAAIIDAVLRQRQGNRSAMRMTRTGIGYDVHRFADGPRMVLGGVEIPFDRGLDGHSDADVVLHAIADALLGAAAAGDIGTHFPPSDPQWKGMDSGDIVARAVEILGERGWDPVNIDATVIAEAPKVNPHVPAMKACLSELTGLPIDAISIKATTNEGMGFVGREEGIAALASATIVERATP